MTNQRTTVRSVASILLVVAVVSLLAMQWRQQETLRRIEQENEQLRQQLGMTPTPAAEVVPEVPDVAEPPVAVAPVVEMVATPTGVAAAPRAGGMMLADIQTAAVEGGIQATVSFAPTDDQPLGVVAVVVRLPEDRDGRILDLVLRGASGLADVSARVSEDGKFAVYHGTAAHVENLDVVLTVSEPVTADFRGTSGFGPYDLIIEADGAYATQKD